MAESCMRIIVRMRASASCKFQLTPGLIAKSLEMPAINASYIIYERKDPK